MVRRRKSEDGRKCNFENNTTFGKQLKKDDYPTKPYFRNKN
jgi:hypothetical protein